MSTDTENYPRRYNRDSDITRAEWNLAHMPPKTGGDYGSIGITMEPTFKDSGDSPIRQTGWAAKPDELYVTLDGTRYRRAGKYGQTELQSVFEDQVIQNEKYGTLVPAQTFDTFMRQQGRASGLEKYLPQIVIGAFTYASGIGAGLFDALSNAISPAVNAAEISLGSVGTTEVAAANFAEVSQGAMQMEEFGGNFFEIADSVDSSVYADSLNSNEIWWDTTGSGVPENVPSNYWAEEFFTPADGSYATSAEIINAPTPAPSNILDKVGNFGAKLAAGLLNSGYSSAQPGPRFSPYFGGNVFPSSGYGGVTRPGAWPNPSAQGNVFSNMLPQRLRDALNPRYYAEKNATIDWQMWIVFGILAALTIYVLSFVFARR